MFQYSKMGFQKGNKLSDNPKSITTQFKKGVSGSISTQFLKGHTSWNRELKGYNSGVQNPFWKGGLEFRKTNEKKHLCSKYRFWMFAVKGRDNWKCRIANEDCNGRLEAHHILNWIDYPELRYEINNGITLCYAHHPRKRAEEKKLIPFFKELVLVPSELLI